MFEVKAGVGAKKVSILMYVILLSDKPNAEVGLYGRTLIRNQALEEDCGFNSKDSFCRHFKSRHQMTPTEYLKLREK